MTVAPGSRLMTEEMIVEILTNTKLSNGQMADKLGLAVETVRRARVGFSYSDIRPDIPRWKRYERQPGKSCYDCVHGSLGWRRRSKNDHRCESCVVCDLDFPEPKKRGARFADQCSCYIHKDEAGAFRKQAAQWLLD